MVDGELRHGAELLFDRKEAISEMEMKKLLRDKDQLNVFRPVNSFEEDSEFQN